MNDTVKKYLPWIIATIMGFLALYFGVQTPDPVQLTGVVIHDTVSVQDTVVIQGKAITRVVYKPGTVNTVEVERLIHVRDTINAQIAPQATTFADIRETVRLPLKDSSFVDVVIDAVYNIEAGVWKISANVANAVVNFECPEGTTVWEWVWRGVAAVLVIASQVIK